MRKFMKRKTAGTEEFYIDSNNKSGQNVTNNIGVETAAIPREDSNNFNVFLNQNLDLEMAAFEIPGLPKVETNLENNANLSKKTSTGISNFGNFLTETFNFDSGKSSTNDGSMGGNSRYSSNEHLKRNIETDKLNSKRFCGMRVRASYICVLTLPIFLLVIIVSLSIFLPVIRKYDNAVSFSKHLP